MHCGTRGHPGGGCHAGPARPHGASCGCGRRDGAHAWRRFQTREETLERLERYLGDLQKEAQAVEERIAALKDE
jgi:hypothetical protein